MDVFADDYALDKNHIKKMASYGMKIDPVDMNGGYVAFNKFGPDNLQRTQDNIRRRFELDVDDDSTS